MFEDWDLIVSSFLTQYGIRIRTREFETVCWDEFKSLLSGIGSDTPLGRIVAIRSETDRNVIDHFTSGQRRIYDAWQGRRADKMRQNPELYKKEMEALERQIAALFG